MPAMASAMSWTILLIILGASFGARRRSAAMLRHGRAQAKGGGPGGDGASVLWLAPMPPGMQHGRQGKRRGATMTERRMSATEAALENQRLGGLQMRVAALCTLVQICDGYDLNSVAWAVPSLIRQWHLPPSAFTMAFLWSSIGIMVGRAFRRPDRRSFRPPTAVAGQPDDFRHRLVAQRVRRFARHADGVAVFHRARHRRRVFGGGGVDRRLHAASPARDDDHGDIYRCARWAVSSAARSSRCCCRISAGR